MTAWYARTDALPTRMTPLDGKEFTLEELRDLVGGHIEIVRLNDGYFLVCNEEGHLKRLQVNDFATYFYWQTYGVIGTVVGHCIITTQNYLGE